MSVDAVPQQFRVGDYFSHIDMGFLNRRLAITALGPLRDEFLIRQKPGDDHFTVLNNDHLLVTMLIDLCTHCVVPTLAEALDEAKPKSMFMSTERLEPCPNVYSATRVTHRVRLERAYSKPVHVTYHTSHISSSTGRMVLAHGYKRGYRESMIGLLHAREDMWEIEPIVMGAPWLDHHRNMNSTQLMWCGHDYGEILPEDIDEFKNMQDVQISSADEWMSTMKDLPEQRIKEFIASLLKEPTKNDWGGEENDHFSSNVTLGGRRRTAAFLLKGPAKFKEMTPAMCGKNGDQIFRLAKSGADISVIQHSHLIGPAVRETLRSMTVTPGSPRKFCIIDGQATYRMLKAYGHFSLSEHSRKL